MSIVNTKLALMQKGATLIEDFVSDMSKLSGDSRGGTSESGDSQSEDKTASIDISFCPHAYSFYLARRFSRVRNYSM